MKYLETKVEVSGYVKNPVWWCLLNSSYSNIVDILCNELEHDVYFGTMGKHKLLERDL